MLFGTLVEYCVLLVFWFCLFDAIVWFGFVLMFVVIAVLDVVNNVCCGCFVTCLVDAYLLALVWLLFNLLVLLYYDLGFVLFVV